MTISEQEFDAMMAKRWAERQAKSQLGKPQAKALAARTPDEAAERQPAELQSAELQSEEPPICLFCGGELPASETVCPAHGPQARLLCGVCEKCAAEADPGVLEWIAPAFRRQAEVVQRHYGRILREVIDSHRVMLDQVCRNRESALAIFAKQRDEFATLAADEQQVILRLQKERDEQTAVSISLANDAMVLQEKLGVARRWAKAASWAAGILAALAAAAWWVR